MKNLKKTLMAAFAAVTFSTAAIGQGNDAGPEDGPALKEGRLYTERSCRTFRDFVEAPATFQGEVSYPSLMALYNSSSFGRRLMAYAAETAPDLQLCDMALSATELAVYQGGQKIGVDYKRHAYPTVYVYSLAHELAHHYQFTNGLRAFDPRRSLADNQRALLAMETAAPVVEALTLFQAAQEGSIDWRTSIHPANDRYHMMTVFTALYQKVVAAGYDQDQHLNLTGFNLWLSAFGHQQLLDDYNSSLIRFTLLSADYLQPDFVGFKDPGLDWGIHNAGNMGGGIHFTSLYEMPPNDQLFGANQDMREIFEAVEWYRSLRMLGENHSDVQAEKTRLAAAGNRFIHADFEEITDKIRQGMDVQTAFKSAITGPAVLDVGLLNPAAAFKDNAVRQALQNWGGEPVVFRSGAVMPVRSAPAI